MCDHIEITSCNFHLYVSQFPSFMEEVNDGM